MSSRSVSSFSYSRLQSKFLSPQPQSYALSYLQNTESAAINNSPLTTVPSFRYTGSGLKSISKPKTLNFRLKKQGPIAGIIITLVTIVLGIIFGLSSSLGTAIEEVMTRATDSQYISYTKSTNQLMRETLSAKRPLSPYMEKRFKKQGIEVKKLEKGYELEFSNKTINSDNFEQVMKSDLSFREAFTKAKRGRAANFFDKASDKIFKKLHLTHNIFQDYKQTGNHQTDKSNYDQTMTKHFSGETYTKLNSVSDQNTDQPDQAKRAANGDSVSSQNVAGDSPRSKAHSFLSDTAGKVSSAGGIGCAALAVGNLINVAIAANQIYQSINFFSTNIENQSKTKAGDGNQANLNQFLNFMTTSTTASYVDAKTGQEKKITGSPLESNGMKLAMAGSKPSKSQMQNFSIESPFTTAQNTITTAGYSLAACATVRTAGAIISLASLAAGGGFIKATIGIFSRNVLIKTGIKAGVVSLLAVMIPYIAKTMFTNPYESSKGVPAGEFFASGASATNSRLARSANGDSVASAAKIQAFYQASQPVLAAEAALNRQHLNHFDTKNPDTFFGSIFTKFASVFNAHKSPFQSFRTFTNLADQSIRSISNANAISGENASYLTTFGDCPKLESIGVKGDIYCNSITVSDLSTTSIPSDDSSFQQIINRNLENNQIKDNSELAKYVLFCNERDSPFGIVDANISNALNTSFGSVGDNLPIIEDFVDIINAGEDLANKDWATGKNCVNSESNPRWNSEFKYYNEWIRRQRILDQMNGPSSNSENPVTSFKNNYEKTHPLDNSPAGYLARISGLTKQTADSILSIIAYFDYLHQYQPQTATAFVGKRTHPQTAFKFKSNLLSVFPLLISNPKFQTYQNLRYRNLIV